MDHDSYDIAFLVIALHHLLQLVRLALRILNYPKSHMLEFI